MLIFSFLRRKWLRHKSFPETWQKILETKVPYYSLLPDDLKQTLRHHLMIFIDEKLFEGCKGFEVTEERKVIISAYACVLILGDPSGYYPDLQTILVYPDVYVAPVRKHFPGGVISEGKVARKGESWDFGSVVLSWEDIQANIENHSSSHSLIFHEFAHQLDRRFGLTSGIGENGGIFREDEWTHILAEVYRKLQRKSRRGILCVLDSYGATNPHELFAVATEAFFLDPHRLFNEFPNLYDLLKSFYNVDPGSFISK